MNENGVHKRVFRGETTLQSATRSKNEPRAKETQSKEPQSYGFEDLLNDDSLVEYHRDADRIVVMKQGLCVEIGTYEELMALKGEF
jgi:hypothetical protein